MTPACPAGVAPNYYVFCLTGVARLEELSYPTRNSLLQGTIVKEDLLIVWYGQEPICFLIFTDISGPIYYDLPWDQG